MGSIRLGLVSSVCASLFVIAPSPAQCGTTISGNAFNTTWTRQGSPYCVQQSIQVGHLNIEAGVEVLAAPGVTITVATWLRAIGTRAAPIVFRPRDAARWGGLVFQGPVPPTNASLLHACVVRGAAASGIRILDNDRVHLEACVLRDNHSAGDGGGLDVRLASGALTVVDCEISSNRATANGGGVHAILGDGAWLFLQRCTIRGNATNLANVRGTYVGGGVRVLGNLALDSCLIAGNSISTATCGGTIAARGGGVHVSGSAAIANSVILANRCETYTETSTCGSQNGLAEGAGIYMDGDAFVTSTVIARNLAAARGQVGTARGSGMFIVSASTAMRNVTIARNLGDGLFVGSATADVRNSILWFNAGAQTTGPATICYSNVQGGSSGCTGNIDFNPLFAGNGERPEDYALHALSPCVDAGDPASVYDDVCNPPSWGSRRNDIGATGGPASCGFRGPAQLLCAGRTYGDLRAKADSLLLDWAFTGTTPPYPGTLTITGGAPNGPAVLALSLNEAEAVVGRLTILVDPASGLSFLPLTLDGSGSMRLPLPLYQPAPSGLVFFLQAFDLAPEVTASNGVRLAPCW